MTKKEVRKINRQMMLNIDDLQDQLTNIKTKIPEEYFYSIRGFLNAAGYDMDMVLFTLIEPDPLKF